jgi:hypothetical protein
MRNKVRKVHDVSHTSALSSIFFFISSGHVLSMPHDDSNNCIRWFGHLDGPHMMASVFFSLNKTLPWSPCSARYVTEFFDNGYGRITYPLNLYPSAFVSTLLFYSILSNHCIECRCIESDVLAEIMIPRCTTYYPRT